MRLVESSTRFSSLFEHDLRANAFRVCREGKPLHTFPDHALGISIALQLFPSRRRISNHFSSVISCSRMQEERLTPLFQKSRAAGNQTRPDRCEVLHFHL